MKENVIIGRLIPAGKHYTGENGVNPDAEYFDPEEAEVDVSEKHIAEVQNEMENESNF
jgi:hypothetical protein